jgi:glycosyltransferase involved in cell wall biosynthesis
VALNRRLADELSRATGQRWNVTVAAPASFKGELGYIQLERSVGEVCELVPIPTYGSRSPHVFLYGARLAQLLRQDWDLVHCWEEPFIFSAAQVAWWAPRKAPLVFFTFQNWVKRYPPPFNWVEGYCLSRCSGWIAAGATVAQAQLEKQYGVRPHRIIPLGVDLRCFYPCLRAREETRRLLGWSVERRPVIGYLGRFIEEKGLRFLTKILDMVHSPWCALFVGSGPMEAALRRWAENYPDRVRVIVGVRHDEVPKYLNAMDLLCAPSQTTPGWREQFGRMLIEAFACGIPVIASDSGEIPYVVGDAGVVVPEWDEAAWIERMGAVLENPRLRADLSERGLERAQIKYSWPVIARQHLEFFEEMLQNRTLAA